MIAFTREQIYLVTGASSGLGRAAALLLNRLGAGVIANGRDAGRLEEVRKQAATPEAFFPEALDLTQCVDSLPDWVTSLRKKYGKLSGMACCAGWGATTTLRTFDTALARALLEMHVLAPILLCKGFADRRNNVGKGASIVFIGSVSSRKPYRCNIAYNTAKGALAASRFPLCAELMPLGIRLNVISPGLVRTPLTESMNAVTGYDFLETSSGDYPFGIGEPRDVAHLTVFLLSGASNWLVGQNIVIDGGLF